jgi:hypothetical protein
VIAFIAICYVALYLLIFNRLALLKKNAPNICAFAGVGVVLIGSIVFMWYTFAPMSGDARVPYDGKASSSQPGFSACCLDMKNSHERMV